MQRLSWFTLVVAALLAGGEIARWWGNPRMLPLVLDELIVAAALIGGALACKRYGPQMLAAAWASYCGLFVALLVPTLDHLLYGPPKESAGFYATLLSVMLALGLWGLGWALSLGVVASRAR